MADGAVLHFDGRADLAGYLFDRVVEPGDTGHVRLKIAVAAAVYVRTADLEAFVT